MLCAVVALTVAGARPERHGLNSWVSARVTNQHESLSHFSPFDLSGQNIQSTERAPVPKDGGSRAISQAGLTQEATISVARRAEPSAAFQLRV